MNFHEKLKCFSIFFLFLTIGTVNSIGQDKSSEDSLRSLIKFTTDPQKIISLEIDIANLYKNSIPDSLLVISERIIEKSKKIDDKAQYATGLRLKAQALSDIGPYQEAMMLLEEAIEINESIGAEKELAKCLNNLGLIFYNLGNYDESLEFLLKSLKIRQKINDIKELAGSYNNIGMVYNMRKMSEEALRYYNNALDIHKQLDNTTGQAQVYNNIALVYEELQDLDKALEYYTMALELVQDQDDLFGQSLVLSNIGGVYGQKGNLNKSEEFYNRAIEIQHQISHYWGLAYSYKGLSNIYAVRKNYSKAIEFAKTSLEIGETLDAKMIIAETSSILYDIYKEMGDYRNALIFHEKFKMFADSIASEETQSQLVKLETEFKLNKQFEDLQKEQQLKEEKLKDKAKIDMYWRVFLIIAIVLALAFSIYLYFNRNKLKEATAIAEQASIAKSEFVTNMSHEIRTPLNAVIGFSDLLLRTKMEETQHQYATTISQSAQSLLSIVNDILDFSKIESGKMELSIERTNLIELKNQISSIMSFQASTKNLELKFVVGEGIPKFVWVDEIRLRQVLLNLISNAIKFTKEGSITIKIELLRKTNDDKGLFRFSVIDTGEGIAPSNQKRIFEAFSQADASTSKKFGGTGLGLTISNKLLALMNTTLKLESIPGKGSIFYFDVMLPGQFSTILDQGEWNEIERITKDIPDNDLYKTEAGRKRYTILIAEDNPVNLLLAQTLVRDVLPEANILVASNGYEAIEVYKSHTVDLILMDVQMPELNGYETTRFIRSVEKERSIPIIALTAGTVEGEKEKCLAAGMDDYIAKPIIRSTFIGVLLKWSVQ